VTPPPVSKEARLLGAEAIGWGASRVVVVLFAEQGDESVQLRTFDPRRAVWSAPAVLGDPPPVRTHGAMCTWQVAHDTPAFAQFRRVSKLLVFGGFDGGAQCTNDVYCLTAVESLPNREVVWRWSTVRTLPGGDCPSARAHHAISTCDGVVYVHGGMLADGAVSGEFWSLTISGDAYESVATWQLLMDASEPGAPRPRQMHTLCCQEQDKKLFLFGGVSTAQEVGKEVFAYHVAQDRWDELTNVRAGCNRSGSLRYAHSGCTCGPLIVTVGGTITGYCESTQRKAAFGVRLFDTRNKEPACASSPRPFDLARMSRPQVTLQHPFRSCPHTNMHTHTHAHTRAHSHARAQSRTRAVTHARSHAYVDAHAHAHAHAYAHMHVPLHGCGPPLVFCRLGVHPSSLQRKHL
jgi:hypothetical protein